MVSYNQEKTEKRVQILWAKEVDFPYGKNGVLHMQILWARAKSRPNRSKEETIQRILVWSLK